MYSFPVPPFGGLQSGDYSTISSSDPVTRMVVKFRYMLREEWVDYSLGHSGSLDSLVVLGVLASSRSL